MESPTAQQPMTAVHGGTPLRAAYAGLLEHCASCRTCLTRNENGTPSEACPTADVLYDTYRQARRETSSLRAGKGSLT